MEMAIHFIRNISMISMIYKYIYFQDHPNLSIIWKQEFCQAIVVSVLLSSDTTWTLTKYLEKKLDGNYTKILCAVLNKSWKQHPTKTTAVQPLTSHLQNYPGKVNKTCWKLLGNKDKLINDVFLWTNQCWLNSKKLYSSGLPSIMFCVEDLPRIMTDRDEW